MIDSSNMVALVGGLTRDPEYREEIGLITFSIAIDNAGRESNQTATGFFDIVVWTKPNKYSPEALGEYVVGEYNNKGLAKGSRVSIVGRLNHDRYETKEGNKASKVTIIAEQVRVVWSQSRSAAKAANAAAPVEATSTASDDADATSYRPEPF